MLFSSTLLLVIPAMTMTALAMPVVNVTDVQDIVKREVDGGGTTVPLAPIPTFYTSLEPGTCSGLQCGGGKMVVTTAPKFVKRGVDGGHTSVPLAPSPTWDTHFGPASYFGLQCGGKKMVATPAPEVGRHGAM